MLYYTILYFIRLDILYVVILYCIIIDSIILFLFSFIFAIINTVSIITIYLNRRYI